jgi:hypothetical protein
MWRVFAVPFASVVIILQMSAQDTGRLRRELRTAIEREEFTLATELAGRLDAAVQSQYRALLIRDANRHVEEALTWLPADTESLWVNQEPFTINAEQSIELLYGRATQVYSVDRLRALNEGKIYRDLTNRTILLVVAGARNIRTTGLGIPAPISEHDVVYLYIFSEPVDLPSADESIQSRPVWRGVATIDARGLPTGAQQARRIEENWIALARPNVLVLTNNKALLAEILGRISDGSTRRALPAALPEWNHTDRQAPFWGLRHYTDRSKPKVGERGYSSANLPQPDGSAVGVAVQFDTTKQRLEVRYISQTQLVQERFDPAGVEFRVDQLMPGVWRLDSDIRARGPWPVHFALAMLGFGEYR